MKKQTCIKQQKGKMGKQNRKEFSLVFSSYWDSSVAIVPCPLFALTCIPELEEYRNRNGKKLGGYGVKYMLV